MAELYMVGVIVFGVICSVGLWCYFDYKKEQLEFQKVCGKQNEEISIKALELEIEKENTKQIELDSNAFRAKENAIGEKESAIKAKEETEQLRIKTDFREKYGEKLY